ncbi:hypothetical protein BVG19_g5229 [[Candida] boidinii]|nr:hypothetical protein BVG19_g5229 [[Candida] boidinii]OWB53757.1 hypothetical protein B5S27_g5365 [[Candida] boidinii]
MQQLNDPSFFDVDNTVIRYSQSDTLEDLVNQNYYEKETYDEPEDEIITLSDVIKSCGEVSFADELAQLDNFSIDNKENSNNKQSDEKSNQYSFKLIKLESLWKDIKIYLISIQEIFAQISEANIKDKNTLLWIYEGRYEIFDMLKNVDAIESIVNFSLSILDNANTNNTSENLFETLASICELSLSVKRYTLFYKRRVDVSVQFFELKEGVMDSIFQEIKKLYELTDKIQEQKFLSSPSKNKLIKYNLEELIDKIEYQFQFANTNNSPDSNIQGTLSANTEENNTSSSDTINNNDSNNNTNTQKRLTIPNFLKSDEKLYSLFLNLKVSLEPINTSILLLPKMLENYSLVSKDFYPDSILKLINYYSKLNEEWMNLNKYISKIEIELIDERWFKLIKVILSESCEILIGLDLIISEYGDGDSKDSKELIKLSQSNEIKYQLVRKILEISRKTVNDFNLIIPYYKSDIESDINNISNKFKTLSTKIIIPELPTVQSIQNQQNITSEDIEYANHFKRNSSTIKRNSINRHSFISTSTNRNSYLANSTCDDLDIFSISNTSMDSNNTNSQSRPASVEISSPVRLINKLGEVFNNTQQPAILSNGSPVPNNAPAGGSLNVFKVRKFKQTEKQLTSQSDDTDKKPPGKRISSKTGSLLIGALGLQPILIDGNESLNNDGVNDMTNNSNTYISGINLKNNSMNNTSNGIGSDNVGGAMKNNSHNLSPNTSSFDFNTGINSHNGFSVLEDTLKIAKNNPVNQDINKSNAKIIEDLMKLFGNDNDHKVITSDKNALNKLKRNSNGNVNNLVNKFDSMKLGIPSPIAASGSQTPTRSNSTENEYYDNISNNNITGNDTTNLNMNTADFIDSNTTANGINAKTDLTDPFITPGFKSTSSRRNSLLPTPSKKNNRSLSSLSNSSTSSRNSSCYSTGSILNSPSITEANKKSMIPLPVKTFNGITSLLELEKKRYSSSSLTPRNRGHSRNSSIGSTGSNRRSQDMLLLGNAIKTSTADINASDFFNENSLLDYSNNSITGNTTTATVNARPLSRLEQVSAELRNKLYTPKISDSNSSFTSTESKLSSPPSFRNSMILNGNLKNTSSTSKSNNKRRSMLIQPTPVRELKTRYRPKSLSDSNDLMKV